MAQTDLRPDTNISSSGWDDGSAAFDFSLINEDIEGSPDADFAGCANTDASTFRVGFTSVPGDFSATTNFDLKIRARSQGRVDDNPFITMQLFDNTATQVGSNHTLGYGSSEQTITESFATYTFSDTGWDSLSSTQLNGLELLVTYTRVNSGMPDSVQIDVAAVEGLLDYTTGVTETPTFGGATASGTSPSPLVPPSSAGAIASGVAPASSAPTGVGAATASGLAAVAQVSVVAGGAIAGGNAPAAPLVETPVFGGATAAGVSPLALVPLTPGGALSGGNEPTAPLTETPVFGGAPAAGVAPVSVVLLTASGAVSGGVGASAVVTFSPTGATASGRPPLEVFPGALVLDRNFDAPEPIPATFDLPVPIGQVS